MGYVKNSEIKMNMDLILELQGNRWEELKELKTELKKLPIEDSRRVKAIAYIKEHNLSLNHGMFVGKKPTNIELRIWEDTFLKNLKVLSEAVDRLLDILYS